MTARLPLVIGADGLPQQIQSGDSVPGLGAVGAGIVNFGLFPGATDAQLIVADTGVLSSSSVSASIAIAPTSSHSADEHWCEELQVYAGDIVAGQGFTVYARTCNFPLYGAFNINWSRI
jgi:hypothetical protein